MLKGLIFEHCGVPDETREDKRQATSATVFWYPTDIAFDNAGDMYVAD